MKYYKDTNNTIYADPILENHVGLVEITQAEVDAILAPTQDELDALEAERIKADIKEQLNNITVLVGYKEHTVSHPEVVDVDGVIVTEAYDEIVVDNEGVFFDGNDTARADMLSAINASDTLGLTETQWKLSDNSWKVVTVSEMREALALSIQAKGKILAAANA